jgi:Ca2+-binding EF-hand superfamily protein
MKSTTRIYPMLITAFAAVSCAPKSERIPENRTERQMLGVIEKFDRWDYNGDGRLTLSELEEASKVSGYSAEEILKFYDTNGDGAITLREAQDAYKQRITDRP